MNTPIFPNLPRWDNPLTEKDRTLRCEEIAGIKRGGCEIRHDGKPWNGPGRKGNVVRTGCAARKTLRYRTRSEKVREIRCRREDVIGSGGCGYRLTEWIAVEDGEDQAVQAARHAAK